MDILIRYFDHVENRAKVCYLDSKFFGHATHQDLSYLCRHYLN